MSSSRLAYLSCHHTFHSAALLLASNNTVCLPSTPVEAQRHCPEAMRRSRIMQLSLGLRQPGIESCMGARARSGNAESHYLHTTHGLRQTSKLQLHFPHRRTTQRLTFLLSDAIVIGRITSSLRPALWFAQEAPSHGALSKTLPTSPALDPTAGKAENEVWTML